MKAPSMFTDFSSFTQYIDTLGVFHINPSLVEIQTVLERMELTKPDFAVIQVLGTNGKGSTSSMIAALCQQHGLCTGLFTSPHFVTPRERILVNSKSVPEEDWVTSANAVMREGGETLTYFELMTAIALHMFGRHGVQAAIIEAGLGGVWDSTTAITADMRVYTPIGLDHIGILGNSLHEIATDKAGAIRSDVPVITAKQETTAQIPIAEACQRHSAPLFFADSDFSALPKGFNPDQLSLQGSFQGENIRLALAAFDQLTVILQRRFPGITPLNPTPDSRLDGLKTAWIAGRFQQIEATPTTPPFILDGAHNPHAMAALGLSLAKKKIGPAAVIFTCLSDKQPENIIPHLRALSTGPIFIPPLPSSNTRAIPPADLASMIGLQAEPVQSFAHAIELATQSRSDRLPDAAGNTYPILICGSLYLLSEFYKMYPQHLWHLTL